VQSVWTLCLVSAGGTFVLSCLLAMLVQRIARDRKVLSDPKKVRFYTSERPLLGHIPVFVSFFLPFALTFGLGIFSDDFFYTLVELKRISIGLFLASLFLVISATYSDVRNDPGDLEWLYIIGSSLLLYFFEIRFIVLKIPLIGDINVRFWGLPLLMVWVLLVVSITELLDFFEGLASAVITLISLVFFHLQIAKGQGEVFVPFFFATLGGAVAGLLPFQLFQKKILYGKSGNKLVGFLFATGTVIARRKETTGQFFLFPIVLVLFVVVLIHFLFLESQLRPISPTRAEK